MTFTKETSNDSTIGAFNNLKMNKWKHAIVGFCGFETLTVVGAVELQTELFVWCCFH
jgi:hypothetical protein